jgi:trk/ktr system potassium uptake protein
LLKDLLHVASPLGAVLIAFTAAYLAPVAAALFYGDGALSAFLIAAGINLAAGAFLWWISRAHRRELKARDGYLLVSLTWLLVGASAMLPLHLAIPGLSWTRAYFEAISGLTTTGATVLTGLDHLPHALNLWRHELCWLGGLGIIGLGMAVLPLLGIGGMQLYRAEATGPIKESKLRPRFVQTARLLWMIYAGLTAICFLALRLAGMSWFDALCHAMAVLSLSGFSTHDASIGYYNSPLIEMVLMVFMLAAAINFATHFQAWRGRSFKLYARDFEARYLLLLVLGSCLALSCLLLAQRVYPDFWTSLRRVSFNLISTATDCGLVSTDYGQWPLFAGLWMLLLSCISASAGSTGGGIKGIRTLILFKQSARELFGLVHPTGVHTLKIGGQVIPERAALSVFGFLHLYTVTAIGLSLLLVFTGMDFLSAFSAVIATINNTAHGLGATGPAHTFGALSTFQTWVCIVSMLAGRLELLVLVVPLTPAFWRE